MKVRKSTPPAAVPVSASALLHGLAAIFGGNPGERVEREFRDRFAGGHPFFLSSGKAALYLLLEALKGMNRRSKVIIPGYTCFSVPSAVRKAGLRIVLCDLHRETLDFDYDKLERLADEDTLCIVSTHLFGIRADVGRTREVARRKGIFVVEDAAQALGLPAKGERADYGDARIFSLARGKNITCGSGGIILTGSDEIAQALRGRYGLMDSETFPSSVKTLLGLIAMGVFMSPYLYWIPDGLAFLGIGETIYNEDYQALKMDNLKYGLMIGWEGRLRSIEGRRAAAGERYRALLGLDGSLPIYAGRAPYLRFPVYVKDPARKSRICSEYRHLGISGMYPSSIGEVVELSGFVSADSCPESTRIAKTLVTLPTHHLVDEELCERIRSAIGNELDERFLAGARG